MTLDRKTLGILEEALAHLDAGFDSLPPYDPPVDLEAVRTVVLEAADRLRDNFPYPHPFYAGQMLKPPHPAARLAYALSLWINPNNHALDGGRASSAMEKEAVNHIAAMFGWSDSLGHFAGGGTMANLEALWVAGRLHPGRVVLASDQAHYTHERISDVLGLAFDSVATDARGRLDVAALERRLEGGDVGTVVATLGTTGFGAVDPLPEILRLRDRYDFRVHVDTAYGGYFALADNLGADTRAAFDALGAVDSIVIDPHKHGLQPYGCGCVLFRDPGVGVLYRHDSPYTYFSSGDLHLGEIGLECSRPGAAAVAVWTTLRLLPLDRGGVFAKDLENCRSAALEFARRLDQDPRFQPVIAPELDIVVWAPRGATGAMVSERSHRLFNQAAARGLHLALIEVSPTLMEPLGVEADGKSVTCLRSCLMKADHLEWLDSLWATLDAAAVDLDS